MDPKNPIQFNSVKAWDEIRPYYDKLFELREKRDLTHDRERHWDWFCNRLLFACLVTGVLIVFMGRWLVVADLCLTVVWGFGMRSLYQVGRELVWSWQSRRLCRKIDKINALHLQHRHLDD